METELQRILSLLKWGSDQELEKADQWVEGLQKVGKV